MIPGGLGAFRDLCGIFHTGLISREVMMNWPMIMHGNKHGFDRRGECGCEWSSVTHGEHCPRHDPQGESGTPFSELLGSVSVLTTERDTYKSLLQDCAKQLGCANLDERVPLAVADLLAVEKQLNEKFDQLNVMFLNRGEFCQSLLDQLQILREAIEQTLPFISMPCHAAHMRATLKRADDRRRQYESGQ